MKHYLLGFILFCFLACHHPPFSMNYRDKKDHLQERFKVRYPNTKQVYYKGRFKNNIPQKIVYFYPQGQKLRTEKCTREGTIHTVFYYRNG